MDEPISVEDTGIRIAQPTGVFNEPVHHRAMGPQEIGDRVWIQLAHEFVYAAGIFDLANFPGGPEHAFAVDDRRDGVF
ncbi:hypothetical protein [Actinomyces sp.]|uniref:hypothetical protein n=1 Tax=Actinomyces sp. TaxID=29317 RepID=UPI0026DB7FDF|nr:hypothetical protein [Actinomyces sp.]